MSLRILLLSTGVFTCLAPARAGVIAISTPAGGTVNGWPVAIQAVFTTANGTLDITLSNLLDNPRTVEQALSGLAFTVSPGLTAQDLASASMISSQSTLRTIEKGSTSIPNGQYTSFGPAATGWAFDAIHLQLCVLCTGLGAAGPEHLLIGGPDAATNRYADANGSIAGNPGHNPFLAEVATFALQIPGITPDSTITGATFYFGTGPYTLDPPVPEPGTWLLAGGGALLLLGPRLKRRSRARH